MEATDEFTVQLGASIARALRSLLESKHLYQSVRVVTDDMRGIALKAYPENKRGTITLTLHNIERFSWVPVAHDSNWGRDRAGRVLPKDNYTVAFEIPDIKTYCASTSCGRPEPFNFRSVYDVLCATVQMREAATNVITAFHRPEAFQGPRGVVQTFAFSYQCQSCKGAPEVFLVRREGLKLTLCGRAPMEHVDVPKQIPERVRGYFSGAIVAFQSGQTLPALFMLRTFVEQWAKPFGGHGDKADQAIARYMDTLPAGFSDAVPSLAHWYEKLSSAIHAASEDSRLFEEGQNAISHHFEAWQVLRRPDPGAAPPSK